ARVARADCLAHSDLLVDGWWKLKNGKEGLQFEKFGSMIFRNPNRGVSLERRLSEISEADLGSRQEVDVYMHTSSFVEIEDHDQSRPKAVHVLKKWGRSDRSDLFAQKFFSPKAAKNKKAKNTVIELTSPSKERLLVTLYLKEDPGNHGNITLVPLTLLDSVNSSKMLGQFFSPFEDKFYFWQCWEVSRRMLQTGVVVAVQLFSNEMTSLIYAVLLAFVAITLHLSYTPFKNDSMDQLQLTVLMNQFLLQLIIIWFYVDASIGTVIGIVMVAMQVGIMGYTLTLVGPAFSPAFIFMKEKLMALVYIAAHTLFPGFGQSEASRNLARPRTHSINNPLAVEKDKEADPPSVQLDCATGEAVEARDEAVEATTNGERHTTSAPNDAYDGSIQVMCDEDHDSSGMVTFSYNHSFYGDDDQHDPWQQSTILLLEAGKEDEEHIAEASSRQGSADLRLDPADGMMRSTTPTEPLMNLA
ncbi:hypothetical protein CYMTET_14322, partial [Cymbomonas tetramitiformis]